MTARPKTWPEFWDRTADRLPGWPSERQWVTLALFGSFWAMLKMAEQQPKLWDTKLFEVVFQGFALTAIIGMVVAFFFAANKGDEQRTANTGKFADAIHKMAENQADPDRKPEIELKPGESTTVGAEAAPGGEG